LSVVNLAVVELVKEMLRLVQKVQTLVRELILGQLPETIKGSQDQVFRGVPTLNTVVPAHVMYLIHINSQLQKTGFQIHQLGKTMNVTIR
jgi:hypothetical protein